MKDITRILILVLSIVSTHIVWAACPKDHIAIGCNADGEPNTLDDMQLYLDISQKYRNSALEDDTSAEDYQHWYYEMSAGGFGNTSYFRSQPGLDFVSDPNQTPNGDFDLKIHCVAISDGLTILNDSLQPLIEQAGDSTDYTDNAAYTHVHLTYRAATETQPQWFTFYIDDDAGNYEPSETCTIIFCQLPLSGDIHTDGVVDILDLEKLAAYWCNPTDTTSLTSEGLAERDVFDGADINRDYRVDMLDFAYLAENWLFSE